MLPTSVNHNPRPASLFSSFSHKSNKSQDETAAKAAGRKFYSDHGRPSAGRRGGVAGLIDFLLPIWYHHTRRGTFLSDIFAGRISPRRVVTAVICCLLVIFVVFRKPSTLALSRGEIERVWAWEIASGHYPSHRKISLKLPNYRSIENPAIPPSPAKDRSHVPQAIVGTGLDRIYLPPPSISNSSYPPRPTLGAAIDLDVIMDHCDFSRGKYVRDCLALLRANAGLDQGLPVTEKSSLAPLSFLTIRRDTSSPVMAVAPTHDELISLADGVQDLPSLLQSDPVAFSFYLSIQSRLTLLGSRPTSSPPPSKPRPQHPLHPSADPACDPDNPKIFHVWWTNDFSDKPYVTALSFLYTQRLFLVNPIGSPPDLTYCRPQLWIWISPDSPTAKLGLRAEEKMMATLRKNPWAQPLLHPRFAESLKFKLWNTTEQLDGVHELKGWRSMNLYQSGGKDMNKKKPPTRSSSPNLVARRKVQDQESSPVSISEDLIDDGSFPPSSSDSDQSDSLDSELFSRGGTNSASEYDRPSVVLSDMARFVLLHRFGGIYLDADTIFLRDWEELWGWRGAFAYRWSRLKLYNTAVLKMSRGSALGSMIFRTAKKNGGDFHPMLAISPYMKEAGTEQLLLRLPDALFDPAWLNTEKYQRDRPAFPYFKTWDEFFAPSAMEDTAPSVLGYKGFFRGAFSYHYHNFWWLPFDPTQNYPDLGSRFLDDQVNEMKRVAGKPEGDDKESSWATVLKRTFEKFVRGDTPNAYGEWLNWGED